MSRSEHLLELKARELERFQIAHHQRTGEVLTPDQARPLLKVEREIQVLRARDDMVARLQHARKMQGASRARFAAEEGYPDD